MSDDERLLERRFHDAMLGIYDAAKALPDPYVANRFLGMVNRVGGREAANTLLASANPSEGFTQLILHGNRLDLSVEYLVLKSPWNRLFEEEQLAIARKRLEDVRFAPPPDSAEET